MARTKWNLDPDHTQVELSVRHMMFTKVHGHFNDVSGTIEIDEQDPDNSKLHVEIGAASIDTGVDDRDDHLRSGDFLEAAKHPKIKFESTSIEGAYDKDGDSFKITGALTIHGRTNQVTLDATFQGRGEDPWGNERAGFEATTEIDRREWGLTWNKALERGGILVGNQVAIELGVQAVREEACEREEAHAGA